MRKVAILGANGFLGLPISKAFQESGWNVFAYSRKRHDTFKLQEIQVDLFDAETLKQALEISSPDVVISTAWDTEHGKYWTSDLNTQYRYATLKFAELCFEHGIDSFVALGTSVEYGVNAGDCNAETSPLNPNNTYSASKIETGLKLREIGESFGTKTHWLRVFQAFGLHEKSERFIPALISSLSRGEKFSIATPDNILDWIHAEDIASAVVFSVENNLNHFVDVGTGIATSVRELSELICRELELDVSLLDYSDPAPGPGRRLVVDSDSQLLKSGWGPLDSLESRISSLG